jgi:hypothetical protein
MPQPVTTVYQGRGRRHIRYIHGLALRIWADTYDCRDDGDGAHWQQSLKDAMTIHRNYLKTGIKVRHPKYAVRVSPTPEPPQIKVKGSVNPPKEEGSFWKDPKSNLWVPMVY